MLLVGARSDGSLRAGGGCGVGTLAQLQCDQPAAHRDRKMEPAMSEPTPTFAIVGAVNHGKSSVVSTLAENDQVRISSSAGRDRRVSAFLAARSLSFSTTHPAFKIRSRRSRSSRAAPRRASRCRCFANSSRDIAAKARSRRSACFSAGGRRRGHRLCGRRLGAVARAARRGDGNPAADRRAAAGGHQPHGRGRSRRRLAAPARPALQRGARIQRASRDFRRPARTARNARRASSRAGSRS